MASLAPQVAVIGMRALRRDVRRLATDQQSELYRAIREAGLRAAEPIAAKAREVVPVVSGALQRSIRASGTRTGAAVRMGRKSVPYGGAVEFGGYPGAREYVAAGRYLFPAAAGLADVAAQNYATAIDAAFNDPTVWTNKTNDSRAVHD